MPLLFLIFGMLLIYLGATGRYRNVAALFQSGSQRPLSYPAAENLAGGLSVSQVADLSRLIAATQSQFGFTPQIGLTAFPMAAPGSTDAGSAASTINPLQASVLGRRNFGGFNDAAFADVAAFEIAHQANIRRGIEGPGIPENLSATRLTANQLQQAA